MRFRFSRRQLAIPYGLFMVLFIALPLLLIGVYAFTDSQMNFTLDNITKFFTDRSAVNAVVLSVWVGLLTTVACILLGFPIAYILSTSKFFRSPQILIIMFILPMWINFILRTLATKEIFHLIGLKLNETAAVIGMIYNFLPFMILPIYTALLKMDKSLIEAAQDLGASPTQVFLRVIIPNSLPGVLSGVLMVFMPTISTFAITDLLTGYNMQLIGNLININIQGAGSWNYGAALSLIILIIIAVGMYFTERGNKDKEEVRGGLW